MEYNSEWVEPKLIYLGSVEELTGQGGSNNDDGWYHSKLAKDE
ncbi:hypothetical protein [Shimazuella soli]|nr:hypothetical protein [Shimazuella soli]